MATIDFRSNDGFSLNSSGIGFYAQGGWGSPVRVGEYQTRTFVTNANGSQEGPEIDNVTWRHSASGAFAASGVPINIRNIPNYRTTLNIRFTHGSVVQTQNALVQIYDRVDTSNPASGVHCQVAEIIHPELLQSVTGSGDTAWINASGNITTVPLVDSPGLSGIRPNGASTSGLQHDWYLALSAKPLSVGSKDQFGLFFSVEYI